MTDMSINLARAITVLQPARVEVGAGTAARLGPWAGAYKRIFVLTSPSTAVFVDRLKLGGQVEIYRDVPAEPDLPAFQLALAAARTFRPDLVVGLGGGSVMDVAKLIAVLWDTEKELLDVTGAGRVEGRRTALAQVATTSGTGSEAGTRALITDPATLAKHATESIHMLADIAILDPELTYSVPPAVTASTGIDALAHCVEAFTNLKAHPLVDGYARMGIALVGRYLARAVANREDTEARGGMMLASYYGGLCLGPVNTAGGHALAYPLGTRLKLPHGLANAIVFPHVLAFNAPAREAKTAEILSLLGLGQAPDRQAVSSAAYDFCRSLGVEMRLSAHGADRADLPAWALEAHAIRRLLDNNPRPMSPEDITAIYEAAH
jgi:alcohol dehydrogenase class IV